MSNPENRAKTATLAIAQVRKTHPNESFDLKDLTTNLKKLGCPYAKNVVSELIKRGLLVKGNSGYYFAKNEPVHFSVLINRLNEVSNAAKRYTAKSLSKTITFVLSEDAAISFLKSRGFKIMRPVTNFEEC